MAGLRLVIFFQKTLIELVYSVPRGIKDLGNQQKKKLLPCIATIIDKPWEATSTLNGSDIHS